MNERYPPGRPFRPPDEPHCPFYPERGLYSSRDTAVLTAQFRELAEVGVDTVMVSWWGQANKTVHRDSQGISTDELIPAVLDAAAAAGIFVSWHIEPYGDRSPDSVYDDLIYLHVAYGQHPAVWRQRRPGSTQDVPRTLPLVFLYDISAEHSGSTEAEQRAARDAWYSMTSRLRGAAHDAVLVSLLVDRRDVEFVAEAGLDGAYTYFAARGFTEGSTPEKWHQLASGMEKAGKLFMPSVGPGYNDTLIRPWNTAATRGREAGGYYDNMWRSALSASPSAVTITSFNEWGEGTQIEAASEHVSSKGTVYAGYESSPGMYMERTREWVARARAQLAIDCASRDTESNVREEL